ncbi:MAG: hypothetical protein JO291_01855, partial [Acidimicrobiia bacterium]|nr:hypothetical protein [Acidimicrobiia bacterium]
MTDIATTLDDAVLDALSAGDLHERLDRLRALGWFDEAGLEDVVQQIEVLVHDRPRVAEGLAELCDAAARACDLPEVCARASYVRARVLAERGEYASALGLIDHARSSWLTAGRVVSALRTDLGRMQILDDLGRHGEAAGVGTDLIEALEHLPAAVAEEEDPSLL